MASGYEHPMKSRRFHPVIAWLIGLASGFIAFMSLALPMLFGMLYAALHPDENGKMEGTLLPELAVGFASIVACVWLAVFVARRLTRRNEQRP